ncbi:MAG: hypothetical protein R8K20_05770 [Gallionellaceae bacterium]
MRFYILLLILLTAQPCFADDPKWYTAHRENGCQSLTEAYEYWPFLSGYWTPTSLFNALDSRYHDAKLESFVDLASKERKKTGKKMSKLDREYNKNFSKSNSFMLSSKIGQFELVLMTDALCKKISRLPTVPEQWLSAPLKTPIPESNDTYIPPTSWHQTNITELKHATRDLTYESFIKEQGGYSGATLCADEKNKHSYLVRGVFTNKLGHHMLFFKDGVLFVIYQMINENLDEKPLLHFSPLVVNLPSELKSVVVLLQNMKI